METKTIVLNDIDYITRDEKPVIRLFGRDSKTNENVIAYDTTFKPYLYILPNNLDECLVELRQLGIDDLELEDKIDIGVKREYIKATLIHPQEVPKLRDIIRELPTVREIREYDIPFYRRYLIDKQITPTNVIEIHGKTQDMDFDVDDDVIIF